LGNIIKTVMISLAFLISVVGKANAAVLDSQFIINQIKKDVTKQISSMVSGRIEIEVTNIPYKTIEVPEGKVDIVASSNLQHFSSLTVARVEILVNGEKFKSFGTPIKISVYDKVWVAKDVIDRGKSLSGSNIALEKKEITLMAETAVREDFSPFNCSVKKTFKPGDIIDTRYVEKIPLIIKNSPISIVFKSSDITITMSAEALDNGKIGDYIRVRSKQYKKDYIGKVISANTVMVNI